MFSDEEKKQKYWWSNCSESKQFTCDCCLINYGINYKSGRYLKFHKADYCYCEDCFNKRVSWDDIKHMEGIKDE